jgi:serine phosphatase RsbU (regulator of sigma subunit)
MKRIVGGLILSILFLNCFHVRADSRIDSLLTLLKKPIHDTARIQLYISIGEVLAENSPDSALFYYTKAFNLSCLFGFSKSEHSQFKSTVLSLKAIALQGIGDVHDYKGNFNQAIRFYNQSLKIWEELNDKMNIATCHKDLGLFYDELGNFNKALEYYLKALKIFEGIGYKRGIAACYNDIGNINAYQNNNTVALNYFLKSLKIKEEIGDKRGIALSNGNIGAIYTALHNYNLAINYYLKSIDARKELGDKKGMAICYDNMGVVQFNIGNYQKSINYYNLALALYQQINDKEGISIANGNLAASYNDLKEYNTAITYGKKSLDVAKEIGALPWERDVSKYLSESYKGLNNFKQALFYYQQFKDLNDSIFNIEKQNQLTKMEAMYQGEKKQKEIEILEKDKKLKIAEIRRVQLQKIGLFAGLLLMLMLAAVIFRSYQQKHRDNLLLSQQKKEIENINEELNQQNDEIAAQRDEIESQRDKLFLQKKDITDSIEYARFIQQALLTSHEILDNCQIQNFILFKPRDIISGDFYWFKQIKNYLYFTAADCTGHGVPGAFMSVLGISLLNEIVSKRDLNPPALVLNELRKRLKKSLQQDNPDTASHDGMDISLCLLDLETKQLQFSGAYNPLYLIRNNVLTEYSTDQMPVGVHPKDKIDFIGKEIQLQSNDQLYIFSDGYISQFGGEKGKKFNAKQFKEMLVEVSQLPMVIQQQMLEKRLVEWQGDIQQIDDILVIGVRI